MSSRRIEHILECSVDTFWDRVFFDPEFNQRLFVGRLHFERWQVTSQVDTGDGLKRVVDVIPKVGEMPGPLRSLLKEGAGYREEGVFIRSKSVYQLRAIPRSLADRVQISGEMKLEALGPSRCRRVYVGQVEAKIFGVGSLVEGRILDDIDKAYDRSVDVIHAWLKDQGLAAS